MGYYTDYELFICDSKTGIEKKIETENYSKVRSTALDISVEFEGLFEDGSLHSKWYSHEADMKLLSLDYPEILFKLSGAGKEDEPTDLWHKYFLNGKIQVCKAEITFPPFDVEKLEESK